MRIKDLATRATKLLTGNAWFAVDNGTKVEKAAYAEVVKQGIEEYAGSTLAGSAQTVKSAIDALNSKNIFNLGTSIPANSDLNNYTAFGNYFSSSASDLTNSPTSVTNTALQLWVVPRANAERAFQVAFVYVPGNLPEVYIRSMTGATLWSNWKQL